MKNKQFRASRTMFCPRCYASGRPIKKNWFMVYGADREACCLPKKSHVDGLQGYTPHYVSWDVPVPIDENGLVKVKITCGMHGCGIEINNLDQYKDDKSSKVTYTFKRTRTVYLPLNKIFALEFFWIRTGYEIF